MVQKAKVIIICPFTQPFCGGVKVVMIYASKLLERGFDCWLWHGQSSPTWFGKPIQDRHFPRMQGIGEALRQEHGISVICTWWETAVWFAPHINSDCKGLYLVQDADSLVYGGGVNMEHYRDRRLQHITEGEWVTNWLQENFQSNPTNVGIGLDHEAFGPLPVARDRNRIFCTYRPQVGAGTSDLKGSRTAIEIARRVHADNPASVLHTFGADGAPPGNLIAGLPHVHHHRPTDQELRQLYCEAGCYILSSRHEGFGLPAAEAMQCQSPIVCTNANGNAEFCLHGQTALVGQSVEELAGHVLKLQRDAGAAAALGEAGHRFVLHYQWPAVMDRLEKVLAS